MEPESCAGCSEPFYPVYWGDTYCKECHAWMAEDDD